MKIYGDFRIFSGELLYKIQVYLAADASLIEVIGFPYADAFVGVKDIADNVFQRLATE
tara:strand:+ start:1942 stop:2115 length:174 start_codon:yes stop_codon:yes gene_type:complete